MNGILTKNNISLININDFNKNIIAELDNYIFVYYKPVCIKNIIKHIHIWNEKYPNFGLIISSKGILIDCSQYDFQINDKINIIDDLYYQSITNGIISVKNEYINNYI